MQFVNVLRTFGGRGWLRRLNGIRSRLRRDTEFRRFHEGASGRLPAFYRDLYRSRLGPYASLLSDAEMTPEPEAVRAEVRAGTAAADRPAATSLTTPPQRPAAGAPVRH
jgi:hypothetical protein